MPTIHGPVFCTAFLSNATPFLGDIENIYFVDLNAGNLSVVATIPFTGGSLTLRAKTDSKGGGVSFQFTVENTKSGVRIYPKVTMGGVGCPIVPAYFTPQ